MNADEAPPNDGRYWEAVELIAQGKEPLKEIAKAVGVDVRTLRRWRADPDFRASLAAARSRLAAEAREHGIAVRENRIRALQDRWEKLNTIIEERAADPELQKIPGGKTGLIVKTLKAVGGEVVPVYAVDLGLLAELRAIEQQAAIECGQRAKDDAVLPLPDDRLDLSNISDTTAAELEQILEEHRKGKGTRY